MKTIRKLILSVAVITFLGSLAVLFKILVFDPYVSRKNQNYVKDIYYNEEKSIEDFFQTPKERFKPLIEINNDIKGWIHINNTVIDYPVLQDSNLESRNNFYLRHDYQKNYSRHGSIFIDSFCDFEKSPQNIILHGHHMRDGTMFANLLKFSDLDFYKSTPIITFDSIYEFANFKIISIFKTNTKPEQGEIFNYLISCFSGKESFLNYVYNVKIRSLIDIPVDIKDDDQLITLSTCSYEFDDFRTVIVARKIRDSEDISVDTQSAKVSENPLMPDCWYKRYGGSAPTYSNFRKAYEDGEISWYSGDFLD